MLQQPSYIQIDFASGEAVSLLRAQGCVLRCVSGRLWVTEDGGGDVVLDAGDTCALTRRGRTVVQSVDKRHGASCQVVLRRSPYRIVAALRLLLPLLVAGRSNLHLVLPRRRPA